MKVRIIVVGLLLALAGCQTKPEPVINEPPGPYGLPPRSVMMKMMRNPITRPMAMRMMEDAYRMKMGLPPLNYPGNCPYDSSVDARGNWCGGRSAASRPGGY